MEEGGGAKKVWFCADYIGKNAIFAALIIDCDCVVYIEPMPKKNIKIGLVDADLLCNGTRHPNLALLKIAGFFRDNGVDFKLIIDQDEDVLLADKFYVARYASKISQLIRLFEKCLSNLEFLD